MEVISEPFSLEDPADVGAVRRRLTVLATEAGLDEARIGDAALIATELATNVLKHARNGCALLSRADDGDARGVAIAVWDRGPGMNIEASLRDGVSTAGTAGNGLGAVSRIASSWDAYAPPGRGTVIVARIFPRGAASPLRFRIGAVCSPYPGLAVCGDQWATHADGDRLTAIVCDGLGHGEGAAEAANAVIAAFRQNADAELPELVQRCHLAARSTRGAAGTFVRLDAGLRTVDVTGVGNVGVWLAGDALKQLATQHGTLGHAVPTPRAERHPWPPGRVVVLCTDGIKSRLALGDDPTLLAHDPATIATVIWRDHSRGRDDATVLVVGDRG
jgi:anti-sigma regulatory factor (Ser/Thr protein kinase)